LFVLAVLMAINSSGYSTNNNMAAPETTARAHRPFDAAAIPTTEQSHQLGVLKSNAADQVQERQPNNQISTLRVPFIANQGQIDEQIGFYARTFGGTLHVECDGGMIYTLPLNRKEQSEKHKHFGPQPQLLAKNPSSTIEIIELREKLVGAKKFNSKVRTNRVHRLIISGDRIAQNGKLTSKATTR